MKESIKQINFIWPYAHEEFFVGELSQQGILVKSKILTLEEIMQIDKRVEKKKVASENKIAIIEQDSSPSTSFVSLYNIDSKNDNFDDALSKFSFLESMTYKETDEVDGLESFLVMVIFFLIATFFFSTLFSICIISSGIRIFDVTRIPC